MSGSDDEEPIASLKNKVPKKKKRARDVEADEDEVVVWQAKKPAVKKKAAPSPKIKPYSATKKTGTKTKKPGSRKKVESSGGKTKRKWGDEEEEGKHKKRSKKEMSKLQRVDEAIKAFEWWTVDEHPEGRVYRTLEHNGVLFAPQYVPHGVKMKYDGKDVDLTAEQEEVATYYAAMPEDGPQLNPTGGQREIFQKNFMADFKKVLGPKTHVKSFSRCDFRAIREHLDRHKAARKGASDTEKEDAKMHRDSEQLAIGYALLDGHLQKVGNFRMEPPGLFRGRGKHPKTGTLKQRCMPEQVAINCGASNAPPRCMLQGRAWGSVQHDDGVTWLSSWHENVMSQNKYVMLASNSSLKGKSDYNKFEKAQQLKGCIDKVRSDYRRNLSSSDPHTAQLATTMWLIDVYALRVGGEKGEDEADTVGCCSLRVEHFTFPDWVMFKTKKRGGAPTTNTNDNNGAFAATATATSNDAASAETVATVAERSVELEFLGKDSMKFKQAIDFGAYGEWGVQVLKNLIRFCKFKHPAEQVFDRVSPPELNAHLSSIMPGLTAKVFRTYNASETLQNELPAASVIAEMDTLGDKLIAYNEANRTVAILCNHQRTVSAALQSGLETLSDALDLLKDQKKQLQSWRRLAETKAGLKLIPLHSGAADPTIAAQKAVDEAKDMKNTATSVEDKIAATEAFEKAAALRKEAKKAKAAVAHQFSKPPSATDVDRKIHNWSEKIKKAEIDLRNKSDNKEVSLGTSKANYCDPRISVAWCKRCDVPVERIFAKTLFEKFAWAMTVGPDWTFDARPLQSDTFTDDE